MSSHQLSPAPAACPYMVRPLGGRSRTSPYKGRNLNTGYTLFSARAAAVPAIDERAAERAAARGPRERARKGPLSRRGQARCVPRNGSPGQLWRLERATRRCQAPSFYLPLPPYCFRGANANEPGLQANCFCFKNNVSESVWSLSKGPGSQESEPNARGWARKETWTVIWGFGVPPAVPRGLAGRAVIWDSVPHFSYHFGARPGRRPRTGLVGQELRGAGTAWGRGSGDRWALCLGERGQPGASWAAEGEGRGVSVTSVSAVAVPSCALTPGRMQSAVTGPASARPSYRTGPT